MKVVNIYSQFGMNFVMLMAKPRQSLLIFFFPTYSSVSSSLGNPEFLLFSQRTEIHRYLLASSRDERLPMQDLKLVAAVDYDVVSNCYYYADTVDDVIMVNA